MAINTLGTLTADGSTSGLALKEDAQGDEIGVHVFGTFGSGTVKIEASMSDSGTADYAPISGASFTANGYLNIRVAGVKRIRATITGSTTPSVVVKVSGALLPVTITNS